MTGHPPSESLKDLIEGEIRSPEPMSRFLERLDDEVGGLEPLVELLRLKEEHHRHSFYVKSEHIWYRRLGWKIMRPLFVLALLAGVGFALQKRIDPATGTALFLSGAACLYVIVQLFFVRWAHRDLKLMAKFDAEYKARLEELLGRLG